MISASSIDQIVSEFNLFCVRARLRSPNYDVLLMTLIYHVEFVTFEKKL